MMFFQQKNFMQTHWFVGKIVNHAHGPAHNGLDHLVPFSKWLKAGCDTWMVTVSLRDQIYVDIRSNSLARANLESFEL